MIRPTRIMPASAEAHPPSRAAASRESQTLSHRIADVGEVRLHYVEMGTGRLVVLLHGFPGFWYCWRYQIPALAAAGFRVIAPDLRGYNLSDKPRQTRAYALEHLAGDVARLVETCSASHASIIGHDWGGGIAWWLGMRRPQLVDHLAILNLPHPARLLRAMRTFRQLRRSWYMLAFQLPWLPEALLRAHDFAAVRRMLRRMAVRPDAFSASDLDRYVDALARPGALTAAVNYYRALGRGNLARRASRLRRISAPTLVIWGERDPVLGAELAEPDAAWVPAVRVVRLQRAGHWVQLDMPDEVNTLLTGFLRSPSLPPPGDGARAPEAERLYASAPPNVTGREVSP